MLKVCYSELFHRMNSYFLFLDIDGELKALILDFCLPTATYATMLLREVFKGDTSASNQMKLESVASELSEKRKVEEDCLDEEENPVKKTKIEIEDDVEGKVE